MTDPIIENEILPQEEIEVPDETEALRSRISELESMLAAESGRNARELNERREFCRIFSGVDPDALPDEVLAQRDAGVPLAAAYALYEKLRQNELSAAAEADRKNASSLNPSVSHGGSATFFTANEVKGMSSRQVRENLHGILRSMKHWGK